jgi:thioester reductase-like protein
MIAPCLLLTGANGFLGEATLREWGSRGKVYALMRARGDLSATKRFKPVAARLDDVTVEVIQCDLLDDDF